MEEKILELIELKAEARQYKGKGAAREIRRNKGIPAIVYGPKVDPTMISVVRSDFEKIVRNHGTSGLFMNLRIEGEEYGKPRTVVVKEIQMDPFNIEYYHVDFHEINMDNVVTINVPVEITGKSFGVENGGTLQVIRRELEVICKPADAPDVITIDITNLDIGDVVHVEDIVVGENVEIPHEVNFTVLTVVAPSQAEELVEEDEEDLLDVEEAVEVPESAEAEPAGE